MTRSRGQRGEGYIREHKDGRRKKWEWGVPFPGSRPVRYKRGYCLTRAEAVRERRSCLVDMETGAGGTNADVTINAWLDHWLADIVKPRRRWRTHRTYATNVDHLRPFIGGLKLAELKTAHIENAYASLLRTHSVSTVRTIHRSVRAALNHAVRLELLQRNPATWVDLPKAPKPDLTRFDEGQLEQLLHAAQGHRLYAMWVLFGATGMRLGEVTGLCWRDVDLERGVLSIRQIGQYQNGTGLIFAPPKTEESVRTIRLLPEIVAVLRAHAAAQEQERRRAEHWQDLDLVFCTRHGTQYYPATIGEFLRRLLKAADLPRIRVHDLRHSAATIQVNRQANLVDVKRMMGHANIKTLLDNYVGSTEVQQVYLASMMDDMLKRLKEREQSEKS